MEKKYYKEKIEKPAKSNSDVYFDQLSKMANYSNNQEPPEMVDDFQKPAVKDLQVEKIDRRGEVVPTSSAVEFSANKNMLLAEKEAKRAAAGKDTSEKVYDAGQYKREYAEKARLDRLRGADRKKASRLAGLKKLSLGGIATSLGSMIVPQAIAQTVPAQAGMRALDEGDPASFLMPADAGPAQGSIDSRIESGTLTEEDKQLLRRMALEQIK